MSNFEDIRTHEYSISGTGHRLQISHPRPRAAGSGGVVGQFAPHLRESTETRRGIPATCLTAQVPFDARPRAVAASTNDHKSVCPVCNLEERECRPRQTIRDARNHEYDQSHTPTPPSDTQANLRARQRTTEVWTDNGIEHWPSTDGRPEKSESRRDENCPPTRFRPFCVPFSLFSASRLAIPQFTHPCRNHAHGTLSLF